MESVHNIVSNAEQSLPKSERVRARLNIDAAQAFIAATRESATEYDEGVVDLGRIISTTGEPVNGLYLQTIVNKTGYAWVETTSGTPTEGHISTISTYVSDNSASVSGEMSYSDINDAIKAKYGNKVMTSHGRVGAGIVSGKKYVFSESTAKQGWELVGSEVVGDYGIQVTNNSASASTLIENLSGCYWCKYYDSSIHTVSNGTEYKVLDTGAIIDGKTTYTKSDDTETDYLLYPGCTVLISYSFRVHGNPVFRNIPCVKVRFGALTHNSRGDSTLMLLDGASSPNNVYIDGSLISEAAPMHTVNIMARVVSVTGSNGMTESDARITDIRPLVSAELEDGAAIGIADQRMVICTLGHEYPDKGVAAYLSVNSDGKTISGNGSSAQAELGLNAFATYGSFPPGYKGRVVHVPSRGSSGIVADWDEWFSNSGFYHDGNGYVPMLSGKTAGMTVLSVENGRLRLKQVSSDTKVILENYPVVYDEPTLVCTVNLLMYTYIEYDVGNGVTLSIGETMFSGSGTAHVSEILDGIQSTDDVAVVCSGNGIINSLVMTNRVFSL